MRDLQCAQATHNTRAEYAPPLQAYSELRSYEYTPYADPHGPLKLQASTTRTLLQQRTVSLTKVMQDDVESRAPATALICKVPDPLPQADL